MLFVLLFIFWIILNGAISLEIALFGVGICLIVKLFTYKTTRLNSSIERKAIKKLYRIMEYLFILIIEVYKANIDIIKLVLSPKPEIKPTLKYITTDLKSRVARVALANSITLTPGTITVSMNDDELLIHAIHASNLDGMEESIFVEKLRRLEE
jgi:multicomponent Na+:H+ antiporter subunit E